MKLSKNFSSAEIACKHCGQFIVVMPLINALQELRDIVGKPLTLPSVYRCKEHNRNVGGAPNSEHTQGTAADIAVPKGMTQLELYEAALKVKAFADSGIGIYPDNNFIHVDVGRSKPARWARVNGKYTTLDVGLEALKKKEKVNS